MNKWVKGGIAALALSLSAGIAQAEWPDGKPIDFVIPYGPGGGFDTIVRAFAPPIEKELGVTIVPTNIPGAGGTKGAASVARSDPDGHTIGVFNIPGYTVSEVQGTDIGFKLSDVTWIANLATESYGIAVKSDSPIKTVADLCGLGRPAKLSDTGLSSTSSIAAQISFDIMKCPIVNVTGYKGSSGTIVGVMRGEVDATLKPVSSLKKYVDTGDMRMIATYTKDTVLEGVQNATEIGHPEFAKFDVRRVVAAPKGLPEGVADKLSAAFMKVANSEDMKTWAAGAGVSLDPVDSAGTTALMDELSTFYAQYKDQLK